MTEQTRGQKLANDLQWACDCLLYDDPRKMMAFNAVVEAIDNSYPKHSLYIDQPIPTITQEMIDSAQSVAWNADQDCKVLIEQYLVQHDWIHNVMGVNDDSLWLHSKTMQKYSNVEDAYDEQLDMEKYL